MKIGKVVFPRNFAYRITNADEILTFLAEVTTTMRRKGIERIALDRVLALEL